MCFWANNWYWLCYRLHYLFKYRLLNTLVLKYDNDEVDGDDHNVDGDGDDNDDDDDDDDDDDG